MCMRLFAVCVCVCAQWHNIKLNVAYTPCWAPCPKHTQHSWQWRRQWKLLQKRWKYKFIWKKKNSNNNNVNYSNVTRCVTRTMYACMCSCAVCAQENEIKYMKAEKFVWISHCLHKVILFICESNCKQRHQWRRIIHTIYTHSRTPTYYAHVLVWTSATRA